MTTHSTLKDGLEALARRSVGLIPACNNDASVRLYLVLPLIALLGYDNSDPLEVYPNHETDPVGGHIFRADFAILNRGLPTIAITTARLPAELAIRRRELAGYFNAWDSAKLAVATNGIVFEFYVDSAEPGHMDREPFLSIDLKSIAENGATDEVLNTLVHATKHAFDADMIAEISHLQLVHKRLRTAFVEEAQAPCDEFCRVMMQRIGFLAVRTEAIERHYAGLVKTALEEALVLPVVERLRANAGAAGARAAAPPVSDRIAAVEHETAIFNGIRQRLAYLADDETSFNAIERVAFKDYVGKLVVYYDSDPGGRLFEMIRGSGGYDKFIFPEPHGEIVTNAIAQLDYALRSVFHSRLMEMHGIDLPGGRRLRIA